MADRGYSRLRKRSNDCESDELITPTGLPSMCRKSARFLTSDSTISLFFPVMANTANAFGRIAGHVAHQFAELSHGGFGVEQRNLDVVGLTAQRMGHNRAICSLLLSLRQLVHVHIGGRDEQCAGTHRFDIIRDGSDRHFSRRRRIKIETVSAGKHPKVIRLFMDSLTALTFPPLRV